MSIANYIFEYGDTEIERQRALNAELLAALQAVVEADTLEAAQQIASAAIAIAIVANCSGGGNENAV